jgi:type I restriction enzyme S subunit
MSTSKDWKTVIISDVADINCRPKKDELDNDLLASFVPMKCVEAESGRFEPFEDKRVGDCRKGYTPFQDGDVLFAKVTPCMENGKAAVMKELTNGIGFGSTEFYALRPKEGIDSYYLYYFISQQSFRDEAARNMTGAVGLRRVPKPFLAEQPIPMPRTLAEQQRIVAEIEKQFTRLDAGVDGLKRVQANLKRYRASVLKAACEGKLVPTEAELYRGNLTTESTETQRKQSNQNLCASVSSVVKKDFETGEQLLERILIERRKAHEEQQTTAPRNPPSPRLRRTGKKYKEPAAPDTEDLPELPEGWTWATLPHLGELNRGKSKHRPRNDKALYGGSYPFIQTGDVRKSNGTIREYEQTYSEAGLQQSRLWPAGTVCITIAANIAETGILSFPACFPDSVVGFIACAPFKITRYVELFLRTAKENLERFAPATAQKNINLQILQEVAVPLPPLNELKRIVEEVERRLSVIEEMEIAVAANLKRAARLRQSILKKAFEGELV